MRNSSVTKSMERKTEKRKRKACWQDDEEMPSVPTRKRRSMLDTTDVNSSTTKGIEGKTANRKRSVSWQDNEEMPSVQTRKLRRMLDTADVNNSRRRVSTHLPLHESAAREQKAEVTECRGVKLEPERHADNRHLSAHEGEQVAQHFLVDNSGDGPRSAQECEQVAQHSLVANSSDRSRNDDEGEQVARQSLDDNSVDAPRSAHECEQVAQHSLLAISSNGSRNDDDGEQVARHSLEDNSGDAPRSAHKGEQVAELSIVASTSDEDSVKCPICSATFTTQEVATPDTCDHTFCVACLQELSQNENNCPIDKKAFNFILVRHHTGGEIIERIHVEPPKRQSECSCEVGEPPCCEYVLGHGLNPVYAAAYILAALAFSVYVLPAPFSH